VVERLKKEFTPQAGSVTPASPTLASPAASPK